MTRLSKRLLGTGSAIVGLALLVIGARVGLSRLDTAAAQSVPVFEVGAEPFSRIVNAEGEVRPVKSTSVNAPREGRRHLIGWLAPDGKTVKKEELLVRFDNEDAVRELEDGKDDERAADARIEKEKLQISAAINQRTRVARLTSKQIEQTKQLGKKDPRYFSRAEVIESEIDEGLLEARLTQTRAARQAEEALGKSRVAVLAVERRKAEIERKEAARELASMEVRAPHDGVFVVQRRGSERIPLKTGDRAWRGMRLGEVAKRDRMEAEVQVLEADAGGLEPGLLAEVWLDAQPDVVWKAKVRRVAPFPKALHPDVPAQYFETLLSIEGDTSQIKPGQRLRARIVVEKIDDAIVVPRQAIFQSDDRVYVYRQEGWGHFEKVDVMTGSGTVGRVVVETGLNPGDRIALRDPRLSADDALLPDDEGEGGSAGQPPPGPRNRGGRR